jgi:hypothetical protein
MREGFWLKHILKATREQKPKSSFIKSKEAAYLDGITVSQLTVEEKVALGFYVTPEELQAYQENMQQQMPQQMAQFGNAYGYSDQAQQNGAGESAEDVQAVEDAEVVDDASEDVDYAESANSEQGAIPADVNASPVAFNTPFPAPAGAPGSLGNMAFAAPEEYVQDNYRIDNWSEPQEDEQVAEDATVVELDEGEIEDLRSEAVYGSGDEVADAQKPAKPSPAEAASADTPETAVDATPAAATAEGSEDDDNETDDEIIRLKHRIGSLIRSNNRSLALKNNEIRQLDERIDYYKAEITELQDTVRNLLVELDDARIIVGKYKELENEATLNAFLEEKTPEFVPTPEQTENLVQHFSQRFDEDEEETPEYVDNYLNSYPQTYVDQRAEAVYE